MRTQRPLIALLAGIATVALVAGCSGDDGPVVRASALDEDAADDATITARGVGTVTGVPDILTIDIGVETRADTAAAALEENNTRTRAVLDLLEQEGVADEDVQTADLSIWPRYNEDGDSITGYQVTNSVRVTLRDLDRSGDIIDAAAGAAGDAIRLNGLSFSIDDTSDLYAAARADAVRRARSQAEQLAEAAGVDLGAVRKITEESIGGDPVPYAADAGAAAGGAPVAPGTQELTLTVTVVYLIT